MDNNIHNFMEYERPSVTADVVLFRLQNNCLQVLLQRRNYSPCQNKYAIPGGFVNIDETIEDTARQKVSEKTGIKDFYLEQLQTFDALARDDRWRVISTAYIGICNNDMNTNDINSNCLWFNICFDKNTYTLENENLKLNLSELAFDHGVIISTAIERLKNKIFYSDIAFEFLPELFLYSELRNVCETILNKKIDNFRRIFDEKVEQTDIIKPIQMGRPAKLYKRRNIND